MPSKQQEVSVSPVLFMSVDGEPMAFFLRPGALKGKLQPLITAGGGILSKVQQPGAILLIDPEEKGSIPETTAHWYVSTQYIHDCVEKDEQLNLEDYKLNPVSKTPARPKSRGSPSGSGRMAYTAEDDAAILSYVNKHRAEIGGNRLWQRMEKQKLTTHSWQSMKYRYRARLAKEEANEEMDVGNSSAAEDPTSLQTRSADSDLTQTGANTTDKTDAQSVEAVQNNAQPESVDKAQISTPAQVETQQTDPQPSDSKAQVETVESETPNSHQPEVAFSDTQTEIAGAGTDEPQTVVSTEEDDDVPRASEPSEKPTKESPKASPQPPEQRRSMRRQLLQEGSQTPELYGKKLRSSSAPSVSPQPSKKTKPTAKLAALPEDTEQQPPPSKRARASRAAEQREAAQDGSGTLQADREVDSVPQKAKKKTENKKLGILELATKEFEDNSESNGDEAPEEAESQSAETASAETATAQPTSTEAATPAPDTAPDLPDVPPPPAQANPEPQPQPGPPQPGPPGTGAVDAPCKAHLFIFESQEEESQSLLGVVKPTVMKEAPAVPSLTQLQLEEDKQRIMELMDQTNRDLVCVTKALLKTSGDFSAALDLLVNPLSAPRALWSRHDDALLLSANPEARRQLRDRYSEEELAKRVLFLEVEG